ncbi:hypothetical protein GEV38_21505 [Pseudomonas sp. 13159349]|uniref:hypothetical protein n=1 Tax=Pseudomonas sp. 13159349 TaxID=2662034 RepID=UPI00156EAB40|nr:hypothetical protein [Pseudomonas sp. 13159349]QKK98381.1 hypothetical protein GEV38_21505 [Pseudomonas sp. 13159349]
MTDRNAAMGTAFRAVAQALKHETDRGTVVLATAWLDESLTKVLQKFMPPKSGTKDDLLGPGKALGDLGTKITLASRLNLIPETMRKSLDLCRKLRNDFAHLASDLTFDTPNVRDRVLELFNENSEVLNVMGESLREAGMNIDSLVEQPITLKSMMSTFNTKELFGYTCAFLNAALVALQIDIRPNQRA